MPPAPGNRGPVAEAGVTDLVVARAEGLYCPRADFWIDPWRPVPRAVITHAHADHARRGHGAYLATAIGAGVLRQRLGAITLQGLDYGEGVSVNGVRVSLHPAGHVLGSAQVRLEHAGQVWVVSGDYFLSGHAGDRNDTCAPFEPLRCDRFVTDSTFEANSAIGGDGLEANVPGGQAEGGNHHRGAGQQDRDGETLPHAGAPIGRYRIW